MKRCPTCNKTYTDPILSFCIDDGTPLVPVVSEEKATIVSPSTNEDADDDVGEHDWNAVAYRPPGSYVPPGVETNRRRVWPWVLGIIGVLVVGVLGLSIAAAVFLPRLVRSSQRDLGNSNARSGDSTNENANQSATALGDNSADKGTDSNSDSAGNLSIPPPTNKEQVVAQLTDLENEWTVANLNADKKKLDRVLADDYVGPGSEGQLQGKAEYIRTIQRDTTVQKWEFEDLQLTLRGDRATLSGKITYVLQDRSLVFDFTDKFVWRDGRWQATGSTVTPRE